MTAEAARLLWLDVLDTNAPYYIAAFVGVGLILAIEPLGSWLRGRSR